ncbi:DNA-binding MarR family transcriptional regulator [Geodermatophilus bullaregiensis]|uniref:MarR family winged helix-turn-helix transcriptional regulator n=1 Tax=Geodermatophilus bullaregiensis TaxID=1564160 RepID=UPI00195A6759|nr:MarR family transcriptional regulator [Geodermatophilus bullaregiensis]MBM7805393.1 DNA-binding MarR family transcriptional regulator [Geodermatophilus bullaregiensis]
MSGSTSADARRVAALDRVLEVTVLLGRDMTSSLAASGLTVARTTLLWQLRATGPSTQRALADALGTSARNVTGLVDGLAGAGLVTREPHPTDRRATLVTLTARAEELLSGMAVEQAQLADQLFGGLSPERLDGLVSALDEVLGRLRPLVPDGAAS